MSSQDIPGLFVKLRSIDSEAGELISELERKFGWPETEEDDSNIRKNFGGGILHLALGIAHATGDLLVFSRQSETAKTMLAERPDLAHLVRSDKEIVEKIRARYEESLNTCNMR